MGKSSCLVLVLQPTKQSLQVEIFANFPRFHTNLCRYFLSPLSYKTSEYKPNIPCNDPETLQILSGVLFPRCHSRFTEIIISVKLDLGRRVVVEEFALLSCLNDFTHTSRTKAQLNCLALLLHKFRWRLSQTL